MPVCYITLSEDIKEISSKDIDEIREIIAKGLITQKKYLDKNHIVVRVQKSNRQFMLGQIEIDIFSQFYLKRYFTRDKRARQISLEISQLLGFDCATWINMGMVGYSRVTKGGDTFFSD